MGKYPVSIINNDRSIQFVLLIPMGVYPVNAINNGEVSG